MNKKKTCLATICALLLLIILFHPFSQDSQLPTIYIITATHNKPVQRPDLLRLCYTLKHVKSIYWIVVEDADLPSDLVLQTVAECNLPHTVLAVKTPEDQKIQPNEPYWSKPKGILQRNKAFAWLRSHTSAEDAAVVYIADDDNVYHLRVFDEMRFTERVSTWLVGLVGEMPWEGCRIENGQIVGFQAGFRPERPFPIDMAAFAVNLHLFHTHPQAQLNYDLPIGYQESNLLLNLGISSAGQLEPKANCNKILAWHTRTQDPLMAVWKRKKKAGESLPSIDDFVYL